MSGKLKGKVALITGAAGGIGGAAALTLAEEGAAVALVDLRLEAAESVAQQVTSAGADAVAMEADVADEDAVAAAVERTVDTFGTVDVLLNNAGLALQRSLIETSVEEWERVMSVNLRGSFLFIKHAAPRMRNGSSIVNIASVAALMAVRESAAYTAAKGGLMSLTRVAAAELGPGIRVNCICPGTILTAMPEEMLRNRGGGDASTGAALTAEKYILGRLGEPDEIARVALFLACADSSFVTGSVITADGGVTAQ